MKKNKFFEITDKIGEVLVIKSGLKNIDLIMAFALIGILFWSWETFLREFFAWLVNLFFPNAYGISRTRVLSEWFVLLPLMYTLGYLHNKIKEKIRKKSEQITQGANRTPT